MQLRKMRLVYMVNRKQAIRIKKRDYFAIYIICAILSCAFSMLYTYSLPHISIVSSYLLNCIIYLIIFVLMRNCKEEYKNEFINAFMNGLIYAARIQAVWGLLQLVLLYTFGININQILFVDILHSTNSRDWIMGFYTGKSWNMRITGLNFENSMFALVICVGMALDNNLIWKLLLMLTATLSLSRTGWIMVAGYVILMFVRWFRIRRKAISSKRIIAFFAVLFVALVTYFRNSAVQRQVSNILLRLTDTTALSVSASRHLLYYPYGIALWFTDANPMQKLFGYGMRCSGIAFSQNNQVASVVGIFENFGSAWAVECDAIGLFLGGGLLAFLFYYFTVFQILRNRYNLYRDAVFIILVGGLTYHYHSISYVVFILLFAALEKNKGVKEFYPSPMNHSGRAIRCEA